MHPVIAKLLITKFATPAILAGTLALAAGGAALVNPDNDHHWHHGCQAQAAQVGQTSVGQSVAWVCFDHDGDGH